MPAASVAAATFPIPSPLTNSGLYGWLCMGWGMVKRINVSRCVSALEPRARVDRRVAGAQRPDQRLLGEGAQQITLLRVHRAAHVRHSRANLGALMGVEQPPVPTHGFVE